MVGLEAELETLRDCEIPCQPQVRISGDRSFAKHDLVDAARRDVNRTCQCILTRARETILRQTHRLDEFQQQNLAWVGLGICLVVVDDFDTVGTSCRPDEADAPLPIDADAVLPCTVAFRASN